jgi:hypothetical protein
VETIVRGIVVGFPTRLGAGLLQRLQKHPGIQTANYENYANGQEAQEETEETEAETIGTESPARSPVE